MKTYWIYYWTMKNGVQIKIGQETMVDKESAMRAAMKAARRGYHASVVSEGRKVYAL